MTLIRLAGFFVLTSLFFQKLTSRGEVFLPPDTDKETGLKAIEKRTNFRVPVETPFDPNFWPARGRRNGEELDKVENCDENFNYDKDGLLCPEPYNVPENRVSTEVERTGNCFGGPPGKYNVLYRLNSKKDGRRHKKQRHFGLPQLMLYGNGVYWEPDNSFVEKKKKEDVFWVARGKKNFF